MKLEEEKMNSKEIRENENIYEKKIDAEKYGFIKNKEKQYNNIYDKIIMLIKILVILIFIFLVIWIINDNNITKNVEYVKSFNNIKAPVQTKTTGSAEKTIGDIKVNLKYLYTYVIRGRVVNIHDYFGGGVYDKLCPKDVGISWGPLATDEMNNKCKWYSAGDRALRFRLTGLIDNKVIKKDEIRQYFSNNHLIPMDDKIKKQIEHINEGEYIKIEGYLVNATYYEKNGNFVSLNTSTTRSDSGNIACEIIYVKNVTWLKQEK